MTHPTERRKFTIAELRRICGFPDDFILTGSYAQQWERLGNSVPPVMMHKVAEVIRDEVLLGDQKKRQKQRIQESLSKQAKEHHRGNLRGK